MNVLKLLPALLLAVCCASVHAEEDDDWLKGKLFPPDIVMKHQAALKLSEVQRKAVRGEIVALQGKIATVDWEIMEAGLEMQEQISKLPVDREAVLARADRVFEAETRKKRAWIEMLINIKNQLTPEQVAYLERVTTKGE